MNFHHLPTNHPFRTGEAELLETPAGDPVVARVAIEKANKGEPLDLHEIAALFGFTRQRVQQVYKRAMRKLYWELHGTEKEWFEE